MGLQALAKEARIGRDTLAALERGERGTMPATLGAVESALARLEEEYGMDDDQPNGNEVEFRVSGNFGVDVVVKGPVDDLAALEAAVSRLVRQMQSNESATK